MAFSCYPHCFFPACSAGTRLSPSPGPGMGLGGSEADKAGVPSIQEEAQPSTEETVDRVFKEEGGGAV